MLVGVAAEVCICECTALLHGDDVSGRAVGQSFSRLGKTKCFLCMLRFNSLLPMSFWAHRTPYQLAIIKYRQAEEINSELFKMFSSAQQHLFGAYF